MVFIIALFKPKKDITVWRFQNQKRIRLGAEDWFSGGIRKTFAWFAKNKARPERGSIYHYHITKYGSGQKIIKLSR